MWAHKEEQDRVKEWLHFRSHSWADQFSAADSQYTTYVNPA